MKAGVSQLTWGLTIGPSVKTNLVEGIRDARNWGRKEGEAKGNDIRALTHP